MKDINPETVRTYLKEAKSKLDRFHADIEMHRMLIDETKRDIKTMEYFIEQYKKTLEMLGEEP